MKIKTIITRRIIKKTNFFFRNVKPGIVFRLPTMESLVGILLFQYWYQSTYISIGDIFNSPFKEIRKPERKPV